MGKARKRISPLYNDMFLRVFGTESSKGAALSLANAILRAAGAPELERVDEISADRTEPGGAFLKSPRLDVVLRCEERYVDLEPERKPVDIHNKSVYYASRLIAGHTPKGGSAKYERIPEIVVITLLEGVTEFEGNDFFTVGRFHWERDGGSVPGRGNPLFIVIEMDKFKQRYNRLTEEVLSDELTAWLYLLTTGYEREEEVASMTTTFQAMLEFAREYGYALDDPELERAYERELIATMEKNSAIEGYKRIGLKQGRAEGRAEGLAEGRAEGRAEGLAEGRAKMAAKLRELGVDESIIAQAASEGPQ